MWTQVHVVSSCCDMVVGGLKHITVKSLWVQAAVREYSIAIERVSRDVVYAHILASPSSAEELSKHT